MSSGEGRTLADLLDRAAAAIERLAPADAYRATESGALLVDIRSEHARGRDGIVPGSVHIPRTVLEWRTAPDSEWRNPCIAGTDQRLILICDHGWSSTLAAATLVELGFRQAGDVVGGFAAWREAGLPVVASPPSADGGLPGMGRPDD